MSPQFLFPPPPPAPLPRHTGEADLRPAAPHPPDRGGWPRLQWRVLAQPRHGHAQPGHPGQVSTISTISRYLDIYTTPSQGLGSSWSRAMCSPPAHPPGLPWWQGGTQCTQVGGPYNMFSAKFYVSGRQHTVIHPNVGTGLSTRFQLMPQHLAKLGYSSHMVGKWHLGFCHPSYLPTRSLPDIWSFVNLYIQEGLQLILWLLDGQWRSLWPL